MITKKKRSKNVSRTKSKNINHKNTNTNTNTKIINTLTIVKNYYEKEKDTIHVNAYERAIYQIKHWQKPITKGSDLKTLVGIGKGMIEKIDTIIETGILPIIKEKGLEINLDTINKKTKKQNLKQNLTPKRNLNIQLKQINIMIMMKLIKYIKFLKQKVNLNICLLLIPTL